MTTGDDTNLVPEQEEGAHADIHETVAFETQDEAEEFFIIAKERLLNVNHWHDYAGELGAKFHITDGHGRDLKRHLHGHDHIRIDIPGPGSSTGDGYDWVKVETIQYDDYPDEDAESLGVRVRPAANPATAEDTTAHFFKADATSTFAIMRRGRRVMASIYGRNEKPNTATGKLLDNIRNSALAAGAVAGLSALQWKALAKGLVATQ